jgi:hypothetical protein
MPRVHFYLTTMFLLLLGATTDRASSPISPVVAGVPKLALKAIVEKTSFKVGEPVELIGYITNEGSGEQTLFGDLGFGWPHGILINIYNLDAHHVVDPAARNEFSASPAALRDPTRYVRLAPYDLFGTRTYISSKNFFEGPGRYLLRLLYASPVPRAECAAANCFAEEDGVLESEPISITIRE